MKNILVFTCSLFFLMHIFSNGLNAQNVALVIHGGAGNVTKENIPDSLEIQYRNVMTKALNLGYDILNRGGSSQDAVKAVINIMEDSPLFNAGKGAVFTNAGTNELDAAVMDGATLKAGAVSGVRHIKNPIDAAIAVMSNSQHVLLYGVGAEEFAKSQGITMVDSSYFFTQKRFDQLKKAREKEESDQGFNYTQHPDFKFGTVGAVALDLNGNIFVGTSTGGMTNKRYGRIGDTPIIGAGTYANNNTCGLSATGHGEFFMRAVVTHDISALMEYKGLSIQEAADVVIHEKLVKMGGEGGVVGLDTLGNIMMSFNSAGMFRGYIKKDDQPVVLIFRDK
ncbi:MAG: isoaspartyl peptidase/L-asparaginase [Cyclobacteriaceae bacterium]|nr:isoaspartyl peptidase/L-asparaginase [Cyclobacteriaceae bacterium]